MKYIKRNIVPVAVLALAVLSFQFAGISLSYLASEVYTRFIRNILFTLALILPVTCGMGLNFAIVVGAISAQTAMVISVDLMLEGGTALFFVIALSFVLSVVFGWMVAALLKQGQGKRDDCVHYGGTVKLCYLPVCVYGSLWNVLCT